MNILWAVLKVVAAFMFGWCAHRFVWPLVRYSFWYQYFRAYNYVRYVLPSDLCLVWPLLYRSVRRVF